ncbi:cytochrome P450 [Xylariomycetidae sp. FL0641]|nr:cytochrome P450 [Xylariomycetidae sp. FL0641]
MALGSAIQENEHHPDLLLQRKLQLHHDGNRQNEYHNVADDGYDAVVEASHEALVDAHSKSFDLDRPTTHAAPDRTSCEQDEGHRQSPVYPMIKKLTVVLNAASLFGTDIVKNEEFLDSALAYVEETLLNAEIVKLMPRLIAPSVGRLLARRLDAQKLFFTFLLPLAEQRIKDKELRDLGHNIPKQTDCIQWIMETAPRQNPWSAERIIYELMAIWFGSVHILSTTIVFAIQDLCIHPEYVEPLRRELKTSYCEFERTGQGLPLLDSFLKESARLTPVESMSTRRCALQPFKLSNGIELAVGDWVCSPSGAIMQSEHHYPEPSVFNGFRFADQKALEQLDRPPLKPHQPQPSKLTDVNPWFSMWGTGRMACPGRFYATAFMKVILGHIILNYECHLVEPDKKRWQTWRSATMPLENTKVIFTPLQEG